MENANKAKVLWIRMAPIIFHFSWAFTLTTAVLYLIYFILLAWPIT